MLELRVKNAADQAMRHEERENIQKDEYDKLHQRYNDLLRTHIEHVERTKYLMGADKFDMMQSLPKSRMGSMAASVDANVRGISDIISAVHMSQSTHADVNLANHISNERRFWIISRHPLNPNIIFKVIGKKSLAKLQIFFSHLERMTRFREKTQNLLRKNQMKFLKGWLVAPITFKTYLFQRKGT